jgi:ketosteroid isomerase-like protein/uncharacterized glyoxalase superfamily protein PhnB
MSQANAADIEVIAAQLRTAIGSRDLAAFGAMLDENVRWGGEEETPETCHTRAEVLDRLAAQRANGLETQLIEVVPGDDAVVLGLQVKRPVRGGFAREHTLYQVLRVRDQRVVDIRGYASRSEAAARAGVADNQASSMQARQLVPILNVSNLAQSFAWFDKLGWAKKWEWQAADGPATFAAVASGECEVFLCLNGQGGRGREDGIGESGQGMWLSIWVDNVDLVHQVCIREGLEVLRPPRDEPWGPREMQVHHPDGHVLRITQMG